MSESYTAFLASICIAAGDLGSVASKAKAAVDRDTSAQLLIFNDGTGRFVELDLRGTLDEVLQRTTKNVSDRAESKETTPEDARRPGRPKLGVVAREVTLLPRHWDWLASQPGGASVALRKLVEQARLTNQSKDRQRRAQEAAYRFMSAMAGNEPYFEEAARALFAGHKDRFDQIVEPWPIDIAEYARKLATGAFEITATGN